MSIIMSYSQYSVAIEAQNKYTLDFIGVNYGLGREVPHEWTLICAGNKLIARVEDYFKGQK